MSLSSNLYSTVFEPFTDFHSSRILLELVYGELLLWLPEHLAPPVPVSLPHRHGYQLLDNQTVTTNRAFFD